jgi:hypothetical protein
MYAPGTDTWGGYTNEYTSIFRWWPDFQNDFASRMDWSVQSSYGNANHPPEISGGHVELEVFRGDDLYLSGLVSDPDGDLLNYKWWYYKEAGTYDSDVLIFDSTEEECRVRIPTDAVGSTIHIILSVTDNGVPELTRYKRVIINVHETFIDVIPPTVPFSLSFIVTI